ncbi:2-C-methyl-D-erythritol 4-phosphate cytidylyltransferase [Mariniphaga sediminis]|jgi:2-C-methyl-D-erythritol 4-phosphate cytidylyltransferase|uniref:2-C-methyl-D-erythritol 4-phosphate cytidylyltransferase n=1 Tax=Mariniphaga sediminis TaxID=1628158 RepID=A0A399CZL4_9BACT|nr:2-C-methyl-D-erythritol 4-phosphate cytidylyltransferase [Mariniphaga sediminis]RIH64593.1 2-C-methyl-D-erythritol 4-phosphate cytidylyltransferase [Mariniphaga sediminis]
MKKFALIVAGGRGNRMQSAIPKQFIELRDRPLLMHTFEAFLKNDPSFHFILVLPENEMGTWEKLCKTHSFNVKHIVVKGGETRFHSVKNGLAEINEEGIIFIHDGVRPLVSVRTIENCYQTALQKGNALPVMAPSESVREVSGEQNRAVDRTHYFLVQTPQTFRSKLIKTAYTQNYSEKFTDDASVLESTGEKIHLVEGNRENIKITFPEDLIFAKALL